MYSIGKFYRSLAYYHMNHQNTSAAIKFCQSSLTLAISTGNHRRQSDALRRLAWCKWYLGDHSAAQRHAYEAKRLARISADLYREAQALDMEATCWSTLGNYKQCISLCNRARALLSLCGVSGGDLDHGIMTSQAEVHRFKSEYVEAHNIHTQILQDASMEQGSYNHAITLLNLAQIEVQIGVVQDVVQRNNNTAKSIFNTIGYLRGVSFCDVVQAEIDLREGDMLGAKTSFFQTLRVSWGGAVKPELAVWRDLVIEAIGMPQGRCLAGQPHFLHILSNQKRSLESLKHFNS